MHSADPENVTLADERVSVETVNSSIKQFMDSDEIASGSPATFRRHRLVLDVLKRIAGPTTPVARLSRKQVDGTLADRRANGVMDSTLNSYRTTLRMYGRWLVQVGYARTDPAAHLHNVKTVTDRAKRKPITADQVHSMIDKAQIRHPRDGVTILLMVYTGCRSTEITHLCWRDVDLDAGMITVYRSKLKDYHQAVVPAELDTALRKWRAYYEEQCGTLDPAWYVVPALKSRGFNAGAPFRMSSDWPLNPKNPQTGLGPRIQRFLYAVGERDLDGRAGHTLRRTAANLIMNATNDIYAAQTLLGHASVRQTEEYLDQDARKARYSAVIRDWTI